MKTIIRNNAFETNSSSSHSLSVEQNEFDYYLENLSYLINENGDIWLDCKGDNLQDEIEFNSEIKISGIEEKISFMFTLWNTYVDDIKDIYMPEDLINFIKKNTLCEKVYVHNIGNICLNIDSNYKFDFIPTNKEDLYELIFCSDKDIILLHEEY